MTENDRFSWAVEQMDAVGATEEEKSLVQALLETYWKDEDIKVLEMFTALAQDKPLKSEPDEEWRWLPAKPGNVFMQDTVRVKEGAYDGPKAVHNGRVGKIVGIRYGIIKVRYDNDGSTAFTNHRLDLLEKKYT